jgi:regulator of replication initiation timing
MATIENVMNELKKKISDLLIDNIVLKLDLEEKENQLAEGKILIEGMEEEIRRLSIQDHQ